MPNYLRRLVDFASQKEANRPRRFDGVTADGRVVLTDLRGRREARLPEASTKSETLGDDPLAIYKPPGAKQVDAAKAMDNFTGWTYAAVNAVASEAANIQLRLYKISGDDHEEQDDHPLLDLLESVNENMTGTELKYTLFAHLELTGNFYALLDGVRDNRTPPRAMYPLNPRRCT
jgi:phage portal protein BeeE